MMRRFLLILFCLVVGPQIARSECFDAASVGKEQELEIKFELNDWTRSIRTTRIVKINEFQFDLYNVTENGMYEQKIFSEKSTIIGVFEKYNIKKFNATAKGIISQSITYELSDEQISRNILQNTEFDMIKVVFSRGSITKMIGFRKQVFKNVAINKIYKIEIKKMYDEKIFIEGCEINTNVIDIIETFRNSNVPSERNQFLVSITRINFAKSLQFPIRKRIFKDREWEEVETAISVRVIQ